MNKLKHRMDLAMRFASAGSQLYMQKFLKEQLRTFESILAGNSYIANTYYVPSELMALFDINVLYIERMAGFGAANGIFADQNSLQLKHDSPQKVCSYQKFFNSMIEENIIPSPTELIAGRFACDDAWMYLRFLARRKNISLFLIDVLKESGKGNIEYLSNQLQELYDYLKSRYVQIGSISEVVNESNRTLKIKTKIDNLRKQYPGIIESVECLKIFTLYNDLGRKSAYENFNELLNLIQNRIPHYKDNNFLKILLLGAIPLYKNKIVSEIENKYQCQFVYEELSDFGHQYLSEKSFFSDLSKRIINSLFFSVKKRLDFIYRCFEEMNVDGVVDFSQNNCKFLPPMILLMRKNLIEKNMPFINIEVDAINPSNFNEQKCWNQLDAFFEQLKFNNLN